MTSRDERMEANCKIIWGDAEYDIDIGTEDYYRYQAFVREDFR
jgi:hypothetical protein